MAATDPSTPQYLDALERANHIRVARAKLHREVSAGQRTLSDLILSPPEPVQTLELLDALTWLPRVGRLRALRVIGILPEKKRLGQLTARQRRELAERVAAVEPAA